MKRAFRPRQSLGKYRIEKLIAKGGFAEVYRAFDTIEGQRVALKIPFQHLVDAELVEVFRKEVRLTADLDHPNILPVKNACFIDSHFVVAMPLGQRTLSDRLKSRLSSRVALDYTEQMLNALAFAHRRRVVHCDVKPDNLILFSENRLRLSDFGIAKVAHHTLSASGSGTIGYIAPEQAMGKPSLRSDVFSVGLVIYRMFSGELPEWPLTKPLPGHDILERKLHPDFVALIDRAIDVDPRRRFETADHMLRSFLRIKPKALNPGRRKRRESRPKADWRAVRWRQFKRQYGRGLEVRGECPKCKGPISEPMMTCCWCGTGLPKYRGETRFQRRCPRCARGLKQDWRFCPWCFGPALETATTRKLEDRRYDARCHHLACSRRLLMPFMKYCPWCRRKVAKSWRIEGSRDRCRSCGQGIVREFWDHCPWCGVTVNGSKTSRGGA